MKFTESQLEQSVISFVEQQGIPHTSGLKIQLQLTLSKFRTLTKFFREGSLVFYIDYF